MSQVSLREVCVLIERALNLKHAAHYFCILRNAAHRSVTHWSFDCGRDDRWTSAQFKMHVLALFDIIPINKDVFWDREQKNLSFSFSHEWFFESMKFQSIYWENNAFCCHLYHLVIEQFSSHILPSQNQIDWKPLICSVAQINIYLLSFIAELNFGVASNTHTHTYQLLTNECVYKLMKRR